MIAVWVCAMLASCADFGQTLPAPQAECLVRAYPEHVCGAHGNLILMCNGRVLPWRTGYQARDYEDFLDHADLSAQMSERYPLGRVYNNPPARDEDPGRARYEPLFRMMYGEDAEAVRETLVGVPWMVERGGRVVQVTRVNGVDKRLAAVARELSALGPEFDPYFVKDAGTFVWRAIKGTSGRLSMHSFAISIDVGVPMSDYWRWNKPLADGTIPYKNRMPMEIVDVFEKHGFIWGGKWYHFDTMHFEYRPELIACGERRASKGE